MPLTAPLISSSIMEMFPFKGYNNHQLGLEQVCRKVSPVSWVWVKQALVRQGMDREQENRHLWWPDNILHSYIPCITLTMLVHSSSAVHLGSGIYVEGHWNQVSQIQYRCQQQKYKLKDTKYAKNSHLPGCGQILKVSTSLVNGEGVNGGSILSSL